MTKEAAPNGAQVTPANAVVAAEADGSEQVSPAEVNARLLEESKKNKKLAQEYKAQKEELEKASLTEKAEFKKLYESEKKEKDELLSAYQKSSTRSAVLEKATKMGCLDIDALLMLGNKELLTYDKATNIVDGVDEFLQDAQKQRSYLFAAGKVPNINGSVPGANVVQKGKGLNDLSKDEIVSKLREVW